MTSVGDSPRHKELNPSLRAIFRRPSTVDVYVLWRVSSTAQFAATSEEAEIAGLRAVYVEDGVPLARQKDDVLLTQKTSRQHAVTPMLGGRLENADRCFGREELVGLDLDFGF